MIYTCFPTKYFSRLHDIPVIFTPCLGKFHYAFVLHFLTFCPAQTAGDRISYHQKRQDASWTGLYSGLNAEPSQQKYFKEMGTSIPLFMGSRLFSSLWDKMEHTHVPWPKWDKWQSLLQLLQNLLLRCSSLTFIFINFPSKALCNAGSLHQLHWLWLQLGGRSFTG